MLDGSEQGEVNALAITKLKFDKLNMRDIMNYTIIEKANTSSQEERINW